MLRENEKPEAGKPPVLFLWKGYFGELAELGEDQFFDFVEARFGGGFSVEGDVGAGVGVAGEDPGAIGHLEADAVEGYAIIEREEVGFYRFDNIVFAFVGAGDF